VTSIQPRRPGRQHCPLRRGAAGDRSQNPSCTQAALPSGAGNPLAVRPAFGKFQESLKDWIDGAPIAPAPQAAGCWRAVLSPLAGGRGRDSRRPPAGSGAALHGPAAGMAAHRAAGAGNEAVEAEAAMRLSAAGFKLL
jgi:hypothetical protein